MINWINEFVDQSGVRIGSNNVKLSVDNSVSASNSTIDPMFNPEDGDQLKNATAQQRQQGYRNFPWSLVPMPARTLNLSTSLPTSDIDSEPIYSYMDDTEEVTKSYKEKMRDKIKKSKETLTHKPSEKTPEKRGNNSYRDKMIDKVDKSKQRIKEASRKKMEEYVEDIISKKNISKDVLSKNGIPDVDNISEDNPVLVRKVKSLIDIIEKNLATGEQKGMILNYLISNIGTMDIPTEYKQEMVKKLR